MCVGWVRLLGVSPGEQWLSHSRRSRNSAARVLLESGPATRPSRWLAAIWSLLCTTPNNIKSGHFRGWSGGSGSDSPVSPQSTTREFLAARNSGKLCTGLETASSSRLKSWWPAPSSCKWRYTCHTQQARQARTRLVENLSHRTYVGWEGTTNHLPGAGGNQLVEFAARATTMLRERERAHRGGMTEQHTTYSIPCKTTKVPTAGVPME
jgi:hypothetical protein